VSKPKRYSAAEAMHPRSAGRRVECARHPTRHFAYRASMTDVLFLPGIIAPAKSRYAPLAELVRQPYLSSVHHN
jgi:hypothetical protein